MLCECGCGGTTAGGSFLPGHDQRLRSAIELELGGVLQLRSLVQAARAFYDGELTEQALAQVVRTLFYEAGSSQHVPGSSSGCRAEVLEAARAVMNRSGKDHFTVAEVVRQMQSNGSRYAESTIRTHVVSRMCANAPENHAVAYGDFRRTGRGEYRFASSGNPNTA